MANTLVVAKILDELSAVANTVPSTDPARATLHMASATIKSLHTEIGQRELQLQRLKDMHQTTCGVVELHDDLNFLMFLFDGLLANRNLDATEGPRLKALRAKLNA